MIILLALLLAMPVLVNAAVAVAETQNLDQMAGYLSPMVDAYHNGQYLIAAGVLTVIAVSLLKKYVLPSLKVPDWAVPWISNIAGILIGAGISLAGGASPKEALLAVLAGPLASSLYSGGAKNVPGLKS